MIHHRERAHREAFGSDQRKPRVKPKMRATHHQWVGSETRICLGIRNDQRGALLDCQSAKGYRPAGAPDIQPDVRLEPLAVEIDQGDRCNRDAAQLRSQLHDFVELPFRWRIEDVKPGQRFLTKRFIRPWVRRGIHDALNIIKATLSTM
ncbi:MAG: hypothetical protein M3R16_00960 [Pseudomonadota bacterium]|nr:hypothetical protein [Pseudomonadota bacterium]